MIGARQAAGSTISNGGDNSPSNWVISSGAVPVVSHLLEGSFLPENRVFCAATLSVVAAILPSEKTRVYPGTLRRLRAARLRLPCRVFLVQKGAGPVGASHPSPEIYRLSCLVSGVS